MKMNRSSVVVEYRLISSFEEVRAKLLTPEFADRLDKPLAYWALPTDRSSPIALMGRTLRDLLGVPFEQLFATPGIGQKKINCLIELLNRAAMPHPPGAVEMPSTTALAESESLDGGPVDTSIVSEALWVEWQNTVGANGLGSETLGRFAPSLQNLPRVIWNTPLDAYTSLTLAQIRSLKTHGEKRVHAVLEVFGALHTLLAGVHPQQHLALHVTPAFVARIENWINAVAHRTAAVDADAIRRSFVDPLMEQVRIDAGDQIAQLAAGRLRLDGSGVTVRQVARRLGLTRARVYQLLGDVSATMNVRWPDGRATVQRLREMLLEQVATPADLELFDAVVELFFPSKRLDAGFAGDGSSLNLPEHAHAD